MSKAKQVDSFRQKAGNEIVVRLIDTCNGLCDEKWTTELGLDKNNLPKYILVRYNIRADKYLPERVNGKPYWDDATYLKLNKLAPAPNDVTKRTPMKPEKLDKALELFNEEEKYFLTFSDFLEAQTTYKEWCQTYCNVEVEDLQVNRKSGDD